MAGGATWNWRSSSRDTSPQPTAAKRRFGLRTTGRTSRARIRIWVQDYWKNITRENKDKALINMLEASVKRDMTAAKPAWVINFPSAYIDSPFSDSYRKNAESTNQKAIDWLSSHKGSVGIIYMDFAGMNESPDYTKTKLYKTVGLRLVETVINQNFK